MAWTFRRRAKIGPVNVNFSKSGVGLSAGAGPVRFGVDARGRQYTSVRGPFGLYNRQYANRADTTSLEPVDPSAKARSAARSSVYLLVLAGFALVTGLIVPALIIGFLPLISLSAFRFRVDASVSPWYRAVNRVVTGEKWVLLGVFILAAFLLRQFFAGALSAGKRRR